MGGGGSRPASSTPAVRYVTVPQNQTGNGLFLVDGREPRYECGCRNVNGEVEVLAFCPNGTVAACSTFCDSVYGMGGGNRPCPRRTFSSDAPVMTLGIGGGNPNTFVPAFNGTVPPCVDIASWEDPEGRDCTAYAEDITLCHTSPESLESCCACKNVDSGASARFDEEVEQDIYTGPFTDEDDTDEAPPHLL